jgi:hypothetical protein
MIKGTLRYRKINFFTTSALLNAFFRLSKKLQAVELVYFYFSLATITFLPSMHQMP